MVKKIILFAFAFLLPYGGVGGGIEDNDKIFSSGLMAIKNLVTTQDAIREKLDRIEEEEKRFQKELETKQEEIRKEKEKFKMVARSFQGLFPNGRRTETQTRSFLKNLKHIEPEIKVETVPPIEKVKKKKSSGLLTGLLIGGVAAAVAVGLGILVGKSIGNGSDKKYSGGPGAGEYLNVMRSVRNYAVSNQ